MLVSKYEHQLRPKKITTRKKKVQSSGRLCFLNHQKKLRPEKKRYSHLTDGWNKSQITVCRVKIRTHQLRLEKNMTGKKRYDTVVWLSVVSKYKHHQSHSNLRKFLLGFFILQNQWDPNFPLLCISFLLCMDLQPYSHDCFSKISRTLFDFLNNTYWVSFF